MDVREPRFSYSAQPIEKNMVMVTIDGSPCRVPANITVAAALLAHDDHPFCKSSTSGQPRSPYCLMGVCFECLVEINGIKNRQACLEKVVPGMIINRQSKTNN